MDDRDDSLSILIMVTGPVAVVVSTGWQVAWLVLLGAYALLRRSRTRWSGPAGGTPPYPAGA